ncbi:hypothetical protein RvY_19111 [Ramazzottius varieornatus]|uniref:Uncharacterized protein n=1 Tax=Ramazzottius varieornatus TaxID=947166 RepID=A0A1D1W897_RAMVA|nr:hypothetical protein RvY_19111 [Ramazzottius varieornatus]
MFIYANIANRKVTILLSLVTGFKTLVFKRERQKPWQNDVYEDRIIGQYCLDFVSDNAWKLIQKEEFYTGRSHEHLVYVWKNMERDGDDGVLSDERQRDDCTSVWPTSAKL